MNPARIFELTLRLLLGGLLAYAGIVKVADIEQFFRDVHAFNLTRWDVSMILAVFLPWLEIVTGFALIARTFYRGAVALSGVMTVVFIGAIASAWWRGIDLTCGCFGRAVNQTDFPRHLALNGAMLAAVVWLAWLERRRA
ncbi:MAG: MauE/DoxX family redox-associated membrane protein [Chthoniobacteraceae bacterium]